MRGINDQACPNDLAVGDVVVDAFDREMFAVLVEIHVGDSAVFRQLGNNVIARGVGVGIGCVVNLEREFRWRETGISGARSDPGNARVARWTVGVEPKAGGPPPRLGFRQA
jgi:hypothetical protein